MRAMRAILPTALCSLLLLGAVARADDLDALARAVDEHPDDAAACDAYAKAALKANRYDEAIKRLKIGVARNPDYAQGFYWLAVAYRTKKEWADAAD
jgi:predicted Zn-dependent protease